MACAFQDIAHDDDGVTMMMMETMMMVTTCRIQIHMMMMMKRALQDIAQLSPSSFILSLFFWVLSVFPDGVKTYLV